MQRTLIIVKPDAVQRGLTGEIIKRFEQRGLKIIGMKLLQVSRELAEKHYDVHRERPFFAGLVEYITSAPVVVMALEGSDAIMAARTYHRGDQTVRCGGRHHPRGFQLWRLAGIWYTGRIARKTAQSKWRISSQRRSFALAGRVMWIGGFLSELPGEANASRWPRLLSTSAKLLEDNLL